VRFVGRFGADPHGATLQYELSAAGVDLSGCSVVPGHLSGQGIVMLEPDGAASSIVVGGANTAWGKVSCGAAVTDIGSLRHPCQTKLHMHGKCASTLSIAVSTWQPGVLLCAGCCAGGISPIRCWRAAAPAGGA
jgi:sugar/nucleoside kinase (ribokinase family)